MLECLLKPHGMLACWHLAMPSTLSLHPTQGFLFRPSPAQVQEEHLWVYGDSGPVAVLASNGQMWTYELKHELDLLQCRVPERLRHRTTPPRGPAHNVRELRERAAQRQQQQQQQQQPAGAGPAAAL